MPSVRGDSRSFEDSIKLLWMMLGDCKRKLNAAQRKSKMRKDSRRYLKRHEKITCLLHRNFC